MNKKIVFISGVHGVGKTTMINSLISHFGDSIVHDSASEIIAKEKGKNWNQKKVDDIEINQIALERGVKEFLARNDKPLLLDGHFCLLNTKNEVERIAVRIFKFLRPQLIFLLIDEPRKIKDRLNSRDDSVWDYNLIDKFQQEEKEYAIEVSKLVKSDLVIISPFEVNKVISKIENKYYG